MPRPGERTRSRKRATKPSPGSRAGTVFKRGVDPRLRCGVCGQELAGVANTSRMRKFDQSRKRIERPYGGQICANCLKKALRQVARAT